MKGMHNFYAEHLLHQIYEHDTILTPPSVHQQSRGLVHGQQVLVAKQHRNTVWIIDGMLEHAFEGTMRAVSVSIGRGEERGVHRV